MRPIDFVAIHWLAIATILVAVLVRVLSFKPREIGYAIGLFAIGGIALTGMQPTTPLGAVDIPATLSVGAAFSLLLAITTLFISQIWSYRAVVGIAVCGCLGLGGLFEASLGAAIAEQTRNVWNVRFVRPWWLVLRQSDPRDARVGYAVLTESGQQLLNYALNSIAPISQEAIQAMSGTEMEAFSALLAQLAGIHLVNS